MVLGRIEWQKRIHVVDPDWFVDVDDVHKRNG